MGISTEKRTFFAIHGDVDRPHDVKHILETFNSKMPRMLEEIHFLESLPACTSSFGNPNYIYFIDTSKDRTISFSKTILTDIPTFTLKEFEQFYPYKSGDAVKVKDGELQGFQGKIVSAKFDPWTSIGEDKVIYTVQILTGDFEDKNREFMAYELEPVNNAIANRTQEGVNEYFKNHKIQSVNDLSIIEQRLKSDNLHLPEDVTINSNGVNSSDFLKWYEVKKISYPKTYKECCNILGIEGFHEFELIPTKLSTANDPVPELSRAPYYSEINEFYKLLICKAAYWKVFSDMNNQNAKDIHDIYNFDGKIYIGRKGSGVNYVLRLPSKDACQEFHDNFKSTIDLCKELI